MSAETLLQEFHSRGIQLAAEGNNIRYQGPRGALTPVLKARLLEHKREVLAALNGQAELLKSAAAIEVRQQIGAVLIASPRFGQVWLALDPCMADQLRVEESERANPRPVLTTADLAHLQGKSPRMVEAVLNTLTAFPGARVLQ